MTYQKIKYGGTFEEDWGDHVHDFSAMADDNEAPISNRAYFMRFSLRGDARKFYNHLTSNNVNWNHMLQAFSEIYFSEDKQAEISVRLAAITIKDCQTEGVEDDHAALDFLVERINLLTQMARSKDR